jgi:hypothetical protein
MYWFLGTGVGSLGYRWRRVLFKEDLGLRVLGLGFRLTCQTLS